MNRPLIGQQAVVNSEFVGIVVTYANRGNGWPDQFVRVRHPITGVESDYAPHNVQLVPLPEPWTRCEVQR